MSQETQNNQKEILKLNEIASYLRVSETTVARLIKRGNIPAFKIGREWRARRSDIENSLDKKIKKRLELIRKENEKLD